MNFDELQREYDKQKARAEKNARNPDSADAKRTTRIGSTFLLFLGLLVAGLDAYEWFVDGRAWAILVAVPPALLVLGLWGLIAGKLPIKPR
jgi:hypothetical protein